MNSLLLTYFSCKSMNAPGVWAACCWHTGQDGAVLYRPNCSGHTQSPAQAETERKTMQSLLAAWITHCNENTNYVFLFWELRGLSPNFHIHVSVSDSYIPRIGPHILLPQNRQTNRGNIYINRSQTNEWGNRDWGSAVSFLGIFVSNFRYCAFVVREFLS
jgi:hypothetical protein